MTSPLNANALSALLQNQGLNINPVAVSYMGISPNNTTYTFGTIISNTCLYNLTRAINLAYPLIGTTINSTTYNNLISIGSSTIPALGNSKPSTYDIVDPSGSGWIGEATTGYAISGSTGQGQSATWIPYDTSNSNSSVTRWGYLRLHALQAQNEFNYNNDDPTASVAYKEFLASFMSVDSFVRYTNSSINTFANAPNFLDGIYSNMNDLTSADITGVSLSTTIFGQDCITLGKVIDLTNIQKFGLPSVLLKTIKKYNGLTQSLSLALLATGLNSNILESILKGATTTTQQEQQIYSAFLIIVGQDLIDVLVPLNCKTVGLESLADLLSIKKIFPNSYMTLTVPLYNTYPSNNLDNNSKTYYFIYEGNNVSARINTNSVKEKVGPLVATVSNPSELELNSDNIQELPTGFDSYLIDILPTDDALAAGAFSYSMQQIKNIQQVEFQKFSQVVFNIETTKDLNLVNGTAIPSNEPLMNQGINLIGLGNGPNKTYTISDFFGCMTGLPYNWKRLQELIVAVQTNALATIYTNIYNAIFTGVPSLDTVVQGYIDSANLEILSIYNTNTSNVQELISLYNSFGSQLTTEQRARYIALPPVPIPKDNRLNPYPGSSITFINTVQQIATNTLPHMQAQTIEAICNLNTIGGQSLLASLREARNIARLQYLGINLDNSIPSELNPDSEKELLCNGIVTYSINGSDFTTIPSTLQQTIDNETYTPESSGELLMPGSPLPNQNFNPYNIETPIIEEIQSPVYVLNNGIPLDTGEAMYPSSFAGSPVQNIIPINLNSTYSSGVTLPASYSISEAINQVVHCNCDCWL